MTTPLAARCVRALIALFASWLPAMSEHVVAQETDRDSDLEDALRTWRSAYGDGWELEVDRETGFGSFLWGGTVAPLEEGTKSDDEQVAIARQCAELSSALHGLECEYLVPEHCVFLPLGLADTTDKIAVRLRQEKEGVPVVRGFLSFLLARDGMLLALESTGMPGIGTISTTPTISDEVARAAAIKAFTSHVGLPPTTVSRPELVIDQIRDHESRTRLPKLAWRVSALWEDEGVSPDAFRYSIDAHTAEILRTESIVHALGVSGHVQSVVTADLYPPDYAGTGGGTTEVVDMPRISVNYVAGLYSGSVLADEQGYFSIPHDPPVAVTIYYDGEFTDVEDQNLGDFSLTTTLTQSAGNNLLMTPPGAEGLAQSNAYRWVNELRQWIEVINPDDTAAEIPRAEIRVNYLPGTGDTYPLPGCLGKYNPSPAYLLLYRRGTTPCYNGSFSTSIVHEMGHWLNDRYGLGNPSDGFGEGNADIFSMYLIGTPEIANEISSIGGFDFIRTGENSRRYCGNTNQGCYSPNVSHGNALPLMGAFWKMRERLIASQGETNGALIAAVLHNAWMNTYAQTEIRDSIVTKLLLLDLDLYDNDNDIRDGTPHYADITRGFVEQGWPDMLPGGIAVANINPQPSGYVVAQHGPHTIAVNVEAAFYPPLATQDPVKLVYRVDEGNPSTLSPSTVSGDTYSFQIPEPSATPALVQYYFVATDAQNQTLEFPPKTAVWPDAILNSSAEEAEKYTRAGAGDYLWYYVASKTVIYANDLCEGCESDFAVYPPSSTAWRFREPLGVGDVSANGMVWTDPAAPFSGLKAWTQDNADDQDPTHQSLTNPMILRLSGPIEVPDLDDQQRVYLSFHRWLTVASSDEWRAEIIVQTPSEGSLLWQNHRAAYNVDLQWRRHDFELTATLGGELCISWIDWVLRPPIVGTSQERLGGWNLDDFELFVLTELPAQ